MVPIVTRDALRLLKNTRLFRCATPVYEKYASFLMISHAVYPDIFEQPVKK